MKRHFLTGLKAFAVGVMTLLAVSCYDDSKLWGEVEQIKKDLTALQDKLNQEVNTLNSVIGALEAKVAVVKVEKNAAGNYVLTFSNNETLEISAADANANNTGLVTTLTEGDVTYWAVVGADGTVTKLDAVVHPDTKLSFKVDPETNILYVSYDGQNYESTGVVVNDETTFNVVENFVDAEDYVVITVGGVEYKLPKVSQSYFEILSGMQYFMPGQTKKVAVDMNGIVSHMIAGVPAGWSVKFADGILTVTAPAGEYDDFWGETYLENMDDALSGEVVVWVVTKEGETKVGTLKVAVGGTPAAFSFDKAYEKVTVNFSSAYNNNAGVYFGVCKDSDYDAEAIAAKVEGSIQELQAGVFTNFDYESGNYATSAEYTFTELLGSAPEAGVPYIFWSVAPTFTGYNPTTYMPEAEVDTQSIVIDYVTIIKVTVAEPTVSFMDAQLDVKVIGAEEFFIGYAFGPSDQFFGEYGMFSEENLAYYESDLGITLKDLLINGISGGWGPVQKVAYGDVYKGEFKGSITKLNEESSMWPQAGDPVTVFVLPLPAGKTTYTVDDLTYFDIVLPELKYGGDATVAFGDPTDVKYNSFSLAAESTGVRTYYMTMSSEDYEYMGDIVENPLDNIYYFGYQDGSSFVLEIDSDYNEMPLSPNTTYTVVAFSVNAEGECGDVVVKEVTTGGLPYSEAIAVTEIKGSASEGTASAEFTISGPAVKLYYAMYVASLKTEVDDDAEILNALNPNGWNYTSMTLNDNNFKDGKVTVEDAGYVGNTKDRVILAFVEDAQGNFSKVVQSNLFNDPNAE